MKPKFEVGETVLVVNTYSYTDKIKDKAPFLAVIDEIPDDFEFWVISKETGSFYALYDGSIEKLPPNTKIIKK